MIYQQERMKGYKLKTCKSSAKRYRITSSGRIKAHPRSRRGGKSYLLRDQSDTKRVKSKFADPNK